MRAADTISSRAGWDKQFFHRATRGMRRCTGASLFLLILLSRAECIIRTAWQDSQDENDNRFHLESKCGTMLTRRVRRPPTLSIK